MRPSKGRAVFVAPSNEPDEQPTADHGVDGRRRVGAVSLGLAQEGPVEHPPAGRRAISRMRIAYGSAKTARNARRLRTGSAFRENAK